ncbi:SRPBCC family protein [Knoellia sp. CPCC 206453]|uniref:SRPBCC family protein n=1 Tax=Knoellia pratensis TaxID=3404796 RepID=UPI00360F6DD9
MTTTHTPKATGRLQEREGTAYLVFERTFRAPITDVWAAVTESDRLVRWIGHWDGDPTSGAVTFYMTAEAADAPAETIHIDECDAPRRVVMRSARPDDHSLEWKWQIDLAEADGVTTLTFAQEVADTTLAEGVGPGWDYYLDRMVAAENGEDLGHIDFNEYFPALTEHYRRELA